MLQIRSAFDQIKTVQLTLAVATTAHVPLLSNGHLLIPTDYALANAINGFTYAAEISGAPKAAVAWSALDKLYWDDAAKVITNVVAANTPIGHALEPALAGDATTGLVAFDTFAA
jgi:hypothetical protein